MYLDFHLWKEPAHVNDGLQALPKRAGWEIPREVDRCLHTDFQANLPVPRLPLQPCASVSIARRQPAACRSDSSVESVEQHQPVAHDRSRPGRHEGLQAVRNSLRQALPRRSCTGLQRSTRLLERTGYPAGNMALSGTDEARDHVNERLQIIPNERGGFIDTQSSAAAAARLPTRSRAQRSHASSRPRPHTFHWHV